MKKSIIAYALLAAATGLAVYAPADAASPGVWLQASLDGTASHGGSYDDGWASFSAHVNVPASQICYTFNPGNVDYATRGSIRRISNNDWSGTQRVLSLPLSTDSRGCMSADPTLLQDFIDNPDNYIVQLSSYSSDDGAVRGALEVQNGNLAPQGDEVVDPNAQNAEPVG